MAQYSITYSCGHTGTVNLIGPHRDRDRKIKWFEETGLCPECWAEKVAADKAEQLRKITELNSGAGLPALTGTERQVAWAEKIRYNTIKNVPEWSHQFIRSKSFTASQPFREELECFVRDNWPTETKLTEAITEFLSGHSEASWWIDHVADEGKRRYIDGVENGMAESFLYEFLIKSGFKNVFLKWQLRRMFRYMQYDKNDCWLPDMPEFITGKWNEKIYGNHTVYIDGVAKKLSNEEYEIVKNYADKSALQKTVREKADYDFEEITDFTEFHKWVRSNTSKNRNRLLKINNIFGEDAE